MLITHKNRRGLLLSVALASFTLMATSTSPAHSEPPKAGWAGVDDLVEGYEKSMSAPKGWSRRTSSYFPAVWPPDGSGKIYIYVFSRNPDGLRDAERQSSPWARVLIDTTGKEAPKLETLERDVKEAGIQGFFPVMKEDADKVATARAAVEDWSRAKGLPQNVEAAKAALCRGYSWNSVQTDLIKKFHPEYFKWLDCQKYPARGPH